MKEPFVEPYKGYLLKCQPLETPGGKFLANLIISWSRQGGHEDVHITPDVPAFDSERAAADFALAVGMKWVDDRG